MSDLAQRRYDEQLAEAERNRQLRARYIEKLHICAREVPGVFSHQWIPDPARPRQYICRVCLAEKPDY